MLRPLLSLARVQRTGSGSNSWFPVLIAQARIWCVTEECRMVASASAVASAGGARRPILVRRAIRKNSAPSSGAPARSAQFAQCEPYLRRFAQHGHQVA